MDRLLALVTLDTELVKLPAVSVDVNAGDLGDELEEPVTIGDELLGNVLLRELDNVLEAVVVPDVVEVRKPVTLPRDELLVAVNRLLLVVDGLSVLDEEASVVVKEPLSKLLNVEKELAELLGRGRADVVRLLASGELVVDAVVLVVSNEAETVFEPVVVAASEDVISGEVDVKLDRSPVKVGVEVVKVDDSMLDGAGVDAAAVVEAKLSELVVSSVVVLGVTNGSVDGLRLPDSVVAVNPSVVVAAEPSSLVVVNVGTA